MVRALPVGDRDGWGWSGGDIDRTRRWLQGRREGPKVAHRPESGAVQGRSGPPGQAELGVSRGHPGAAF